MSCCSGTTASGGALSGGTITSGGALGGGTAASRGALGGAAVGGTVGNGVSSEPMSGGACHSGEPLLDGWPFPHNFTSEQLELFNTQLSEGYNQFVDTDYSYIRWLEQYHPEAVPPDRCIGLDFSCYTTHSS